jgi:hypothetical protein
MTSNRRYAVFTCWTVAVISEADGPKSRDFYGQGTATMRVAIQRAATGEAAVQQRAIRTLLAVRSSEPQGSQDLAQWRSERTLLNTG